MTVALGTSNSKFSAALNSQGDISVSGTVKGGAPFLTSVGNFDVDLVIEVGQAYCIAAYYEHRGSLHEHSRRSVLPIPLGWQVAEACRQTDAVHA